MDTLIDTIRAAVLPDATDVARQEGARACRTILAALDPMPPASPPAVTQPLDVGVDIAALATAMRGASLEQLLDVTIARMRAALPAGAGAVEPPRSAVRFDLVPIPPVSR